MRIASMTLGILGGIIALTLSLLLLMGGISFLNAGMWENMYDSSGELQDIMPESEFIKQNASAGTVFLATGICSAVAGILGLTGGIIVRKKHVAAGVMMIIASVLSLFGFLNVLSMILLILGGVFALIRDPRNDMIPYPAYPSTSPPYPQQPAQPYSSNPAAQPTPGYSSAPLYPPSQQPYSETSTEYGPPFSPEIRK
jgi:hypothetical protein